jgi:LysR family transcriptional activator of mexEF-oprN operon
VLTLDRIRVLEALLRTRSPSSAALELGIALSSVRKTLGRLRSELNDHLLIRRGDRMILTRRGARLVDPLHATLGRLDGLLQDDDNQVRRATAAIAMRDLFALVLGPALLRQLAAQSPQTTLKLMPYEHHRLADDLAHGTVDVAVAVDPPELPDLVTMHLYSDTFVCVTSDPEPLTLERYLNASHVATTSASGHAAIDAGLARQGHKRKIVAHVPHFAALLQVAESERLCVTLPCRVVVAMRPARLFVHPLPVAIPDLRVSLVWHRKCEQEPYNRWLRGLLMAASER